MPAPLVSLLASETNSSPWPFFSIVTIRPLVEAAENHGQRTTPEPSGNIDPCPRHDHTRTHEPPQANCASSTTLLHPTCRPSPLARRKPWTNFHHLRTRCLLPFPTPSRIHHHRPSSPRTAGPVITLHQAMRSCAIAWHGMAWHRLLHRRQPQPQRHSG